MAHAWIQGHQNTLQTKFFFFPESTSKIRRHWLEIQGCTDAEECGDAGM